MMDAIAPSTATAAAPATKWWLEEPYRSQFAGNSEDGGQMAPKTWENRPDEAERFKKFMAGLNPLHHLPGVGMIYREITGEEIDPGQRVLGGALYGGVLGLVSGLINAVVQHATGKDVAGNAMALLKGDDATEQAAAIAPAASGPPVALVDPALLQADANAADMPPVPLAKPAEVAATPAAPQQLAENARWFPTRGRENARGSLTTQPPTPSPAVMALTNARAEGRLPTAAAANITPRAGAGAYGQAMELSRELQRHYLNMGMRDGLTQSPAQMPPQLVPQAIPATP